MSNSDLTLQIDPDDLDLLYDALRFARDEFSDENGLEWSNAEYERLQALIVGLELLLPTSESA